MNHTFILCKHLIESFPRFSRQTIIRDVQVADLCISDSGRQKMKSFIPNWVLSQYQLRDNNLTIQEPFCDKFGWQGSKEAISKLEFPVDALLLDCAPKKLELSLLILYVQILASELVQLLGLVTSQNLCSWWCVWFISRAGWSAWTLRNHNCGGGECVELVV